MFASLVLLAAALFVAADPPCARTYIAQAGDICDGISAAQNVSTYQLAAVNYNTIDTKCDNLVPGQQYCLGWQGEDCGNTYVVHAGDDCYDIAATYGIDLSTFYANNPQLDTRYCSNLYIGEVVCVDPAVLVPPASPSGTTAPATIPPTATPALPWCD